MNTYVALLRGINVSGQRMIVMKDLKALLIKAGYEDVMTYIQSGNIVFKSQETDTKKLTKSIAELIHHQYGFEVPVMVLTKDDIITLLTHNPYDDGKKDIAKLHVTLLDMAPDTKLLA